ncbi:MAG: glutaminyl-peptide cyclotransferase [Rikenellaceae bacterium]
MHKKTFCLSFVLSILVLISCANKSVNNKNTNISEVNTAKNKRNAISENPIKSFKLNSKSPIKRGTDIEFHYNFKGDIDSATIIFIGDTTKINLKKSSLIVPSSKNISVGTTKATLNAYKEGKCFTMNTTFRVLPENKPKEYTMEVKATLAHATDSYTQGLEFYNDNLYESSGEYGVSYIEYKEFPSMKSLKRKYLDPKYFAEGLTILNDKLYLLTWQENKAFRLNPKTLEVEKEFDYPTEGWGLTTDGETLFLSDGSEKIYRVSPETFAIESYIEVLTSDGAINYINELEWINGEIWANVYSYNIILIINPDSGEVRGIVRAPQLLTQADYTDKTDVLNGIAYDKKNNKIYITGKNWPKMFEIEIKEEF